MSVTMNDTTDSPWATRILPEDGGSIQFTTKKTATWESIKAWFKKEYPCECWRWAASGEDPTADGFNIILIRTAYECDDCHESDSEDDYLSDSDEE